MPRSPRPKPSQRRRRSPLMLVILLVVFSCCIGLGLAQAMESPRVQPAGLNRLTATPTFANQIAVKLGPLTRRAGWMS